MRSSDSDHQSTSALRSHEGIATLQRSVGNRTTSDMLRSSGRPTIQRTIDQDARLKAMDWLATRTRSFVVHVERFGLPKLQAIVNGTLPDQYDAAAAVPTQVDRATHTTALAKALVALGEADLGRLAASLAPGETANRTLLEKVEASLPDTVPALQLATAATAQAFDDIRAQIKDPFLKLKVGGATFTFSKAMAEHMLRRHHPDYLVGPPLQVQSFFQPGTELKSIEALLRGTILTQGNEVKEWRQRRARMTDAEAANDTSLNLRPFYDGKHWELTLTVPGDNRTAANGEVAHFTPTL